MKKAQWLAVAGLAAVLVVMKAFAGNSFVTMVGFFVAAFVVFEFLGGRKRWFQALLGAVAASALYAAYLRLTS
jgi:hypothetical protein